MNALANTVSAGARMTEAKTKGIGDMSYADAISTLGAYQGGILKSGSIPEDGLPASYDGSIAAYRKETGMNLPDSHNNPGNVSFTEEARKYGGVPGQKDSLGNVVTAYPTVQHGLMAQKDLLRKPQYANLDVNAAMERYTGKDDKHGYGAEVLDILKPEDIDNLGVDIEAMKKKKMSDLSEDEYDALTTAMNRREGFGASKKKAGLGATDDVNIGDFKPSAQPTETDLPPRVRQAMEVKKMWDAKGDDDKIKEGRAKLRQAYHDLNSSKSAKAIYEKVASKGYSDETIGDPTIDTAALLAKIFGVNAEEVAKAGQVRLYASALSKAALYEGLITEYGGTYDDLKSQFPAPEQKAAAEVPTTDGSEDFEYDEKAGGWIFKPSKRK